MARRKKKTSGRSVDFSQEVKWFEPDMEYEFEVKAATWEDGNEYDYLSIEFKGVDEHEDSTLFHNASTSPKALFRLRNLLEALGVEVPDGPLDIDTEDLVGRRCMGHTFEDEYRSSDGEKKKSVRCDDFWPVEEKSSKKKSSKKDDDDEDESKSKKRGGKKKDEPEKIAKSEVEDMDDRDDLVELIERFDLDVDPKSRKLKKDDDALKEAIIEALEEGDFLEEEKKSSKKRGAKKDEDEDEDEGKSSGRSRRGSKKSGGKSKAWSEDEIADMSEEDLDDVVEQAGLDIDLEDHRTLRKKKNAVIDALEEAGKLAD